MKYEEMVEAIKDEVDRLLLEKDYGFQNEADYGYRCCLKDIKRFISTLEEPEKPVQKGLDVTDFCKPIDPGIAQCIADHSWEMLGEDEKPMNPDDAMKELDEKIALVKQRGTWDGVDVDKYIDEVRGREPEKPVPADLEEVAKNYAMRDKWTYEHFGDVVMKAVFFGAKWLKEQMMKEAVEYDVWDFSVEACPRVNIPLDNKQYRNGDKVRIIVVKE